jgi:hypothetical protein
MISGNISLNYLGSGCLALAILLAGCAADNPGTWSQDKLEAKVMESLELTEIALVPKPEGGYDGTGKRADGETLTFTLTQDATAHRFSWNAKGDRGFVEEGYYELK